MQVFWTACEVNMILQLAMIRFLFQRFNMNTYGPVHVAGNVLLYSLGFAQIIQKPCIALFFSQARPH